MGLRCNILIWHGVEYGMKSCILKCSPNMEMHIGPELNKEWSIAV